MRGRPLPPTEEKKKPNTVSAALSNDLFEFAESYRWDHRMTKTDVVVEAMTEWANKRGYADPSHSGES